MVELTRVAPSGGLDPGGSAGPYRDRAAAAAPEGRAEPRSNGTGAAEARAGPERAGEAKEAGGGISPKEPESRLDQIAEALNEVARLFDRDLHFRVFKEADPTRLYVEVRDPKDQQVIRKIPPEELLDVAARIEQMIGLLVDATA